MKITILLGPFQPLPPAGFGAVEKVWCDLGRAFASKGHEVTIIGRGDPNIQRAEERKGLRFLALRGFDASGRIALDLVQDLLYALRIVSCVPRSDVVITNTFWAPVVLAPLQKWKGRIVVNVGRFPKGQMWLYRGAAVLQAVSSAVASAICEQSPSAADRVRVLGNPVDLSVFAPTAASETPPAGNAILYVGRVHPEKGVHLLLDAFRLVAQQVPDAALEIVGPTAVQQGGGGAAYLRELESAGAGLRVAFPGPLADERALASAYRRAACFCYPSVAERGEAMGLAVLEAMACGTPCVVSALECFRDFARHGENAVVFDHRSADAPVRLADAICSVLRDREYAARLGKAARAEAERFSVDRMADDYLRLFDSVTAKPRKL